MRGQSTATTWSAAACHCMVPCLSPPVTCSPRQAPAPAWEGSHAATLQHPATPFPLAALCSRTALTSAAQSALWTQTPVAARSPALTATQPATGVAIMIHHEPDGWRQRPERLRGGAGSGALTSRRERPSSVPRGGQ